jgi:putative heme degradation protein
MKKIALLLTGAMIVAGAALAAETKSATKSATAKTHVVEAEVVSADVAASTVKVDTAAAASLKTLKAGEKVKLTCKDNDKGEHEAITHITVEKAPAPAKTK